MTSSDYDRAFEDLIHGRRSTWHVVGHDRERLIRACIDWLTPDRVRSFEASTAADRATWILDKLLPLDEVDLFRRLNSYERWLFTLYPLFRRAPEDMASVTPARFGRGESSAAEAAWIETRTSDDDLLGWHSECLRRGWPNTQVHFNTLAVVEYCRRSPDIARIVPYLEEAPPQEIPVLLHCLMRLLAPLLPRTSTPEIGLGTRLAEAGLGAAAEAVTAAIAKRADWPNEPGSNWSLVTPGGLPARERDASHLERSLADALWVEQQGPEDLDALLTTAPLDAAPRLARIVPADRPDFWERVLATYPYRYDLLHAFCQWCTRERREMLVPHFDPAAPRKRHRNVAGAFERRALECAASVFATYLSLSTPDERARLAENRARPAWQLEALDRWMHAPRELRPLLPRVPGPCEIVFDLREYDPYEVKLPPTSTADQ